MAIHSETQIYIAGNPIPAFQEFSLSQQIGLHHSFNLICRMDVLESAGSSLAENTKNFLGETISVMINSVDDLAGYEELQFLGIVTAINSLKSFNNHGGDVVVISGHSTSILVEDGPHYSSYNDSSLGEILNRLFMGQDTSKLQTAFAPKNSQPLHYSVQHHESTWQYIARLAAQYSEWFYYDGKKLVFGKPKDAEALSLTYGHDLQEFSMLLNPRPNNFNYFTNDYLGNDQHEKKTADFQNPSGYNGFTSDKASKMYPREKSVFINSHNDPELKSRLDKQVEQQKKAIDQGQVLLRGSSDNPGLALGRIIKILGENENFGSYRITSVTHNASENGRYQNHFEAVTAEMDVYPNTNFHAYPRSESQSAIVTENADPEGMGRIKVQFAWQRSFGTSTPWLRIVTPHSGGDKGFHFIPEIGEEILVGFEGGNAERPYVLGSLYHGGQRPNSWKTDMNDIKAIRTRSGHTIEFNDSNGAESITIVDKNSNTVFIDTANNNIEVTANEKMTFNAKNMEFNVAEDMQMNVGQNKMESIGQNHNIHSSNSMEMVYQTKSLNVGSIYNQYSASANLIATAGDMMIHSKGVSTFQGNADVKISKG